ncbi:uncharacterized protein LOC109861073 isoform X2 [Pseudomyrmex gracilis]|uniref:uncharacterized protein LOC109861073 isoform X2 n=1 Tax=Pseudomyrmex gracilis TaxID=219809 RepID=UPI000994A6D9|nr:uncharacterized protein LOC109861073 isoform X2 [Pseudomyrmex gracilis]
MTTKIGPQHTSNSYNGGDVGRSSPTALLEVLAEVASQTLHSENKHINSLLTLQCKSKPDSVKRRESNFTVSQLLSMPVSHLVKQFTIFTSDELKRQYSYTCALVPGCQQKYSSFASEEKARASIKNHLIGHLESLQANKEIYDTFTVKSVNHKALKTNQNKKSRLQQIKKPQETLNKENKDVILEKSTNYLRNILLNDSNIKGNEKQKYFQKSEKETQNFGLKDQMDLKVLRDHSYSERLDDKMPIKKEISFNEVSDNIAKEDNIVLMVIGSDSVHMKEYSHVNQKLTENTNWDQSSDSACLVSDDTRTRNVEVSATKPKGKAKFIGTSKEEREMALAYIERIKKKGNPTGSNLQCRICDPPRSFTAPTTLVSHYRSHAGIKPYECRICKAVFTRRHSLKYHMLIHQNQTRFTCTDCGKKFRHPSHFREHQRRHTGEAPFGCDDCGQRFKTRNTYKRHLKTRHGKILTTVGEVLHLSEEDFQKVRTNRRKKDSTPEMTTNVNEGASNVIVDFGNQHDDGQKTMNANTTTEYVLKENVDDVNRIWIKEEMQFVNDCYEICTESHLDKTDGIETEITIDCKNPDRDDSNMECINDVQEDGLIQLNSPIYDNVEVTNNTDHIYQHNEDYQNEDRVSRVENYEHPQINCNNEILRTGEDQEDNSIHILQNSKHDYHKIMYNNRDNQNESTTYMHLKTKQAETVSSDKNNQIHDKEVIGKYTEDVAVCTEVTSANVNILQTFDKAVENIIPLNQDIISEGDHVSESIVNNLNVFSANPTETNQPKTDQPQNSQYLYVCTENKVTAQSKYINIPLRPIMWCRDNQKQLQMTEDNGRKIRVLSSEDVKKSNITAKEI